MFFRADKGCARADRGFVATEVADGVTITSPTLAAPALSGTMTGAAGARILMPSGTKTLPPYGWTADDDSGRYFSTGERVSFGDAEIAAFIATGLTVEATKTLIATIVSLLGTMTGGASARIKMADGTKTLPPYGWTSDDDTGLFFGSSKMQLSHSDAVVAALAAGEFQVGAAGTVKKAMAIETVAHGTLVAGTGITSVGTADIVLITYTCGSLTVTAAPAIVAGHHDGQIIVLLKDSAAGTATWNDVTGDATSTLRLDGAASKACSARDIFILQWEASSSEWKQFSTKMNI